MTALKNFYLGFNFLIMGYRELKSNRKALALSLVPLIFDLSLFFVGFFWGANHLTIWATEFLLWILPGPIDSWTTWLMYPTAFLFGIAFLVVLIYFVYVLGLLIAGPFMSFMAEGILRKAGIKADVSFWSMVRVAIVKTFLFSLLGVLLFACSFAPGLNVISSFGAFLILAFDSMDYAFEAHGKSFSQRLQFFINNFLIFLGMASVLSLTLIIPGLTLLVLPVAVAGATVIYRGKIV